MPGKSLSLLIALVILVRASMLSEPQELAFLVLGLLLLLSMIWRGDLWAKFVLPMGFWESKARDFKKSDSQGPVIAALGWLLLLVLLFMGFS